MSKVLRALRLMQRMERLATHLYKQQIRAFRDHDIADKLQKASDNEREHANTLASVIYQLKASPSKIGILFDIAGSILGFITVVLGRNILFRIDTWIEQMAVKDYNSYLAKLDFDEDTKTLLSRIIDDEKKHIATWSAYIESPKKSK